MRVVRGGAQEGRAGGSSRGVDRARNILMTFSYLAENTRLPGRVWLPGSGLCYEVRHVLRFMS